MPAAGELNRSGSSYGESRGRLNSIMSWKVSADVRLSRMPSVAAGVPTETLPIGGKALTFLVGRGVEDLSELTLISDGTIAYECRSAEEIVDLPVGGQGVV